MEYKYFYIAIRRLIKKRISRAEFITDWETAQKKQGVMGTNNGGEHNHDRKSK
jgi:hypothetical protein